MMDYSKMSDLQINKAVLEALYSGGPEYRTTDEGKLIILRHVNTVEFGEHVERTEDAGEFDPCNSWADAGPIIQEYGIELGYDGVAWEASCNLRGITPYSDWKKYPESPCRLAMIVFLMMHDKGEE